MNDRLFNLRQRVSRGVLAVLAALVLVTGAAWRTAADSHASATRSDTSSAAATIASSQPAPLTHAVAGGRDSYADVVKIAAPAVVTVHANSKAKVSPTEFQMPDDDLLRRFFGDQFDRG